MKKGHQDPTWDFGRRAPSLRLRRPRLRLGRGAPSSRHYRKPHVNHCPEVEWFASVRRARKVAGVFL